MNNTITPQQVLPDWMQPPQPVNMIDTYQKLGWKLVPIKPGTKIPAYTGWNKPENCNDLVGWEGNIGLAHAYSGTVAIDIDNWDKAQQWLHDRGIDLDALYEAPDAVILESGKEGRGKLLYKLPKGIPPLETHKINEGKECILELRCATRGGLTVQDVLPPPYTLKQVSPTNGRSLKEQSSR